MEAAKLLTSDFDERDKPFCTGERTEEGYFRIRAGLDLAIARAVARDPKILILDDALSSVDTYTEEKILAKLRGVMRGRTSIIVSHRISTVRDADLICVLDEGRIVDTGTHAELIRRGGLYADLYHREEMVEELEAL